MPDNSIMVELSKIAGSLADINAPLNVLSQMRLAEEFYAEDERKAIYKEMAALANQVAAAQEEVHNRTKLGNNRTWEQFMAEESRETVARYRADKKQAMDNAQEANRKFLDYQAEHPVLWNLFALKKRQTPR
jgi:hypothetical protein